MFSCTFIPCLFSLLFCYTHALRFRQLYRSILCLLALLLTYEFLCTVHSYNLMSGFPTSYVKKWSSAVGLRNSEIFKISLRPNPLFVRHINLLRSILYKPSEILTCTRFNSGLFPGSAQEVWYVL